MVTPAQSPAAFRAQAREGIGPLYSGVLHFAFTSALALSVIGWALSRVHQPGWALLTVPVTFAYANLVEYFGHKGPMHRPARGLRLVYERHTLLHHAFFTDREMHIGSARDLKLVLFPPVLIVFFFGLFAAPAFFLLRATLSGNVAALFVATAMGYFLTYEWLHLAYHLEVPAIAALLGPLRRHHQAHHDPQAMSRHNFNITFPICDAIFGTTRP